MVIKNMVNLEKKNTKTKNVNFYDSKRRSEGTGLTKRFLENLKPDTND